MIPSGQLPGQADRQAHHAGQVDQQGQFSDQAQPTPATAQPSAASWRPVDLGSGIVAGFTTRLGGVSQPPWDSLNLGDQVGDSPEHVAANRRMLEQALAFPIAWSQQVHATTVLRLDQPQGFQAAGAVNPPYGVGDALLTSLPQQGLGVLVADCVPVLLADAHSRVVATAHAGRRGMEQGVIAEVVTAMCVAGARPGRIRAAVGPAICGLCYEVPATMRQAAAQIVPQAWAVTRQGTPAIDIPAAVIAQLQGLGLDQVTHVAACTAENPDFFSYRRATASATTGPQAAVTGRQAGIIALSGVSQSRPHQLGHTVSVSKSQQ